MCYPPMDKLTEKAWLKWIDTKCKVYYKFRNDDADIWAETRRPPWSNKSYTFRLPEDITKTDVFNYLYHSSMKLKGYTSREAVIFAVQMTECEWYRFTR